MELWHKPTPTYCLSVVDQLTAKVKPPITRRKIQEALAAGYQEAYENPVFQYRWGMRHLVVSEAVNVALQNLQERD